jgi:hypothetical protein
VKSVQLARAGRKEIMSQMAVPLGVLALAAFLVEGFLKSTATKDFFTPRYVDQFVGHEPHAAFLLVAILGASLLWPLAETAVEEGLNKIATNIGWISLFLVVALSLGTLFVSHNHRLSADEAYFYFQAELFAAGRLIAQVPPDMTNPLLGPSPVAITVLSPETGRILVSYWPGFSLLLAPFVAMGIPWALNPLLSAGCLWVIFRLTQELTANDRAPAWAVLLTLASPGFLAQGISYFSSQAHLFFNLCFVYFLLRQSTRALYLAGVLGGFALTLHNPPLLGLGWIWLKHTVAAQSAANAFLPTDRTFVFPDAGALLARNVDFIKLNLWSAPALIFLAAMGAGKAKVSAFHPAWGALPILAAIALTGRPELSPAWHRTFFTASLFSVFCLTGFRFWQIDRFVTGHLAMSPCLPEAERQVCFIRPNLQYRNDLIQNDPLLRRPRLVLLSEDAKTDAARATRWLGPAHKVREIDGQTVWVPD